MKSLFDIVLLDLDNTIFDYNKSEKLSFIKTMNDLNITHNIEDIYPIFSKINKEYWIRYESNQIPQTNIVKNIFKDFFKHSNLPFSYFKEDIDMIFLNHLATTPILIDNAFTFIQKLHTYTKILVLTNGCDFVQKQRLLDTNLISYIDGLYISEEVGYKKPEPEFFEYVLQKENITDKTKLIILGDGINSDIKGAKNTGITSCLFNPNKIEYKDPIYDYQIHSYDQFFDIILTK